MGISVDWIADLDHLSEGLVRHHRQPFHQISKKAFDAKVVELRDRISSLSNDDAIVALRGIAASIGDGHTFVQAPHRPKLPIEVHWFGNDLTVIRSGPAYRHLIGTRLLTVGDQPVEDLHNQIQWLIPQGENEWHLLARGAELLREPEVLAALGIEPRFLCADETGQKVTISLSPSDEQSVPADDAPISMQRPEEPFWFLRLAKQNAVYVQFRSYNKLQSNASLLFSELQERPANKLIIDMRQNVGGNFYEGRQLMLLPIHRLGLISGQLLVLIGRYTFSAGMANAIDFSRETEALLVGEPMGARPHGYQENGWFTLPNSGLNVSIATRLYRFGPENQPCFNPDQWLKTTYADFIGKRDPVLEWALAGSDGSLAGDKK